MTAQPAFKNGRLLQLLKKKDSQEKLIKAIQNSSVCSELADLKLSEVDQIVFFEKPFLNLKDYLKPMLLLRQKDLNRLVKHAFMDKRNYFKKSLFNKLKEYDNNYRLMKIFFSDHHLSHAASAFFLFRQ